MKQLISFVFCAILQFQALAQVYSSVSDIPNPKEFGDGFVSDPQNYISDSDEAKINTYCTEMRDAKGYEVAIVVVNSINGLEPLPVATDIINEWGIGKGDLGIIILAAIEDRNMAIGTGYNAEILFTDLLTQEIQQEDIIPYLKTDDYSEAMLNGVRTIRNIVMDENVPEYVDEIKGQHSKNVLLEQIALVATILMIVLALIVSKKVMIAGQFFLIIAICVAVAIGSYYFMFQQSHTQDIVIDVFSILAFLAVSINTFRIIKVETKDIWPSAVFLLLSVPIPLIALHFYGFDEILKVYLVGAGFVFLVFLLTYIYAMMQKDPYKKYHAVKLFKMDVFSYIFPLPMLTVDMIVEKQMENWRNAPRFSKKTGLEMRKLSEVEDDEYLEKGQVSEELVKSVDYDVWITGEDDDVLILRYASWFSGYSKCGKCSYKTWYLVYDRVITAATYSYSGTGEKKKACAHCKHETVTRYTIPKKQRSSSSSSSGGFSSGGGGGSWGGGSSGGGGSSSSW